jgi:hypothetical protein
MNTKVQTRCMLFLCFVMVLSLPFCYGYNKYDYLSDYKDFILLIKANWKNYNKTDWQRLDGDNKQFSVIYYDKFKGQLNSGEKLRVRRFDFAYHFYRGDITSSMILSDNYGEILKEYSIELLSIAKELFEFKKDIRTEYMTTAIEQMLHNSK